MSAERQVCLIWTFWVNFENLLLLLCSWFQILHWEHKFMDRGLLLIQHKIMRRNCYKIDISHLRWLDQQLLVEIYFLVLFELCGQTCHHLLVVSVREGERKSKESLDIWVTFELKGKKCIYAPGFLVLLDLLNQLDSSTVSRHFSGTLFQGPSSCLYTGRYWSGAVLY